MNPTTRCAATSNPDVLKIWDPMCEWMPTSRSSGRAATARTASRAAPEVSDRPNFWSSWAVAMNSWVCASTPVVTRTSTSATTPAAAGEVGQPIHLLQGVDDVAAHPCGQPRAQLGAGLVVAVQADPLGGEPGRTGQCQLAAGAHVEAEALLGQPAHGGRAQEGLAREGHRAGHVAVGVGRLERRGPGPEVSLVEDHGRGAVRGREVPDGPAADDQGACGITARRGRPDLRVDPGHDHRVGDRRDRDGRGEFTVHRAGGMCAHGVILGRRTSAGPEVAAAEADAHALDLRGSDDGQADTYSQICSATTPPRTATIWLYVRGDATGTGRQAEGPDEDQQRAQRRAEVEPADDPARRDAVPHRDGEQQVDHQRPRPASGQELTFWL